MTFDVLIITNYLNVIFFSSYLFSILNYKDSFAIINSLNKNLSNKYLKELVLVQQQFDLDSNSPLTA